MARDRILEGNNDQTMTLFIFLNMQPLEINSWPPRDLSISKEGETETNQRRCAFFALSRSQVHQNSDGHSTNLRFVTRSETESLSV